MLSITVSRLIIPFFRYLYHLLVGMDANFQLKNRLRKHNKHKKDSVLCSGLGYQVLNNDYFDHLKKYVNKTNVGVLSFSYVVAANTPKISTCIAFAVLMQKDTRLSTGLRCMGMGGCICICHKLVRPLGLGDLLKGER